jgi:hypothetical protein
MANLNQIVELDVGGKMHKTSVGSLCLKSGYFQEMFETETWKESFTQGKPIFIDRGKHSSFYYDSIQRLDY